MRTSDFDPVSTEIFNRQLRNTTLFVLLVFGVLVLRLWFLQILNGSMYRAKSEHNRIHLRDIPPFRGVIFDRKGEILVGNRPSYHLYVIPEEVQDKMELLKNLNRLVGLDPIKAGEKIDAAARQYPFRPVCLKKGISRDELAFVETHRFNLPGVMIKIRPQRHYIYENLASHLLGYLGEIDENQLRSGEYMNNKPGDLIGKSGIEYRWEAFLKGTRGGEQVEVDAAGRKIRTISLKPPVSGANICLTIDKELQNLAEEALSGKKGAIVAMDPDNGEILALASSPSFDPNMFIEGIDKTTWQEIISSKDFPLQNRALAGQYPPASVFKIIVALAGLEEGLINPEEILNCSGIYTLGRHNYRCWKKNGHGKINLHRALVESCDIYFYKTGKRLGVDKIAHYAKIFGLGKVSGIELGQEKEGLIPTSDWKLEKCKTPWQAGETISMSIGQSFVLVTPIQMVSLISTVFNGGFIYRPQLTKWAGRTAAEKVHEFRPELIRKVEIRPENLEYVKRALVGAVNEPNATGARAKLEDVLVAGKTGTAQVVAFERTKDFASIDKIPFRFRDHAWFVAVAPADTPKIALAILIEHGGHGGRAACPIAKDMIEFYLGITE